jgi:hypothetical protein
MAWLLIKHRDKSVTPLLCYSTLEVRATDNVVKLIINKYHYRIKKLRPEKFVIEFNE